MTQSPRAELENIVKNPYRMHIMPFALYLDNWRWYFRYLGEDFQDKVRYTLVPYLATAENNVRMIKS